MANTYFHNAVSDLNSLWFDSHCKLIRRITSELGCSEKEDLLIEKFLGKLVKIKKQRDKNMPKRPKSSFLYYCDEHRSLVKIKSKAPTDVMKILGKQWGELEDKSKYIEMAKNAKVEYENSIEEYKSNNYYED